MSGLTVFAGKAGDLEEAKPQEVLLFRGESLFFNFDNPFNFFYSADYIDRNFDHSF
jgi:hypothetical protein